MRCMVVRGVVGGVEGWGADWGMGVWILDLGGFAGWGLGELGGVMGGFLWREGGMGRWIGCVGWWLGSSER